MAVSVMKRAAGNLSVQVLIAIAIGLAIGGFAPAWGVKLKIVSDGFVRLITMVVGPIVFLTIVAGIASMGDLKKVGRVGGKALIYFEVATTLALGIGLLVANVIRPGAGLHATASTLSTSQPASLTQIEQTARSQTFGDFVLHIIPDNVLGAFASGNLLQILFFAVLFGCAVASLGVRGGPIVAGVELLTTAMFRVVAIIMRAAPLGAMGAMAYTVGTFGVASLRDLALLMACVYLTMVLFVLVVLGSVCRLCGVSLWRFLVYIREEILLVLGTSSSESALPRMIERMEAFGCGRGVAGLVIPAGYSFNLDGTSIYLSMAVLFIAQAFGVHLSLGEQFYLLALLMLTSKGAAAVTGGGLVTLAATLSATHALPVEGLALLLGIDRFMSESRAITNVIGNGVAAIAVSRMEGEFDHARYRKATSTNLGDLAPVAS